MNATKCKRDMGQIVLIGLVALVLAHAADGKYSGGAGTAEEPYRIATPEDMNDIGNHEEDWDKHFVLVNDIDLSAYTGTQFNIIGRWSGWGHPDTKAFSGVFDGNGKVIRNFRWHSVDRDKVALFALLRGNATGPTVKNLGLDEVNIRAENGVYVGALAARNAGRIANCYVTGHVSGFGDLSGLGRGGVGGLAGLNNGDIANCYSLAVVEGDGAVGGLVGYHEANIECSFSEGTVSGRTDVGGLVGGSLDGGITYCYSSSAVSGIAYVGGLVGSNCMDASVTDCYASGSVAGANYVGGLVGLNTCEVDDCMERGVIRCCYSTAVVQGEGEHIGGLVGWNSADIISCFWDTQASQMDNMCGSRGSHQVGCDDMRGKTTVEMQTAQTFLGWHGCGDVVTWTIDEGNDYPRLWWENRPGEPIVVTLSGLLTGSGTEDAPYLIYTAEELNLVGLFPCDFGKHFKLMADIDLSAYAGGSFNIIGQAEHSPFHGVFDGNGHIISNFSYSRTRSGGVGFFGHAGGAVISNLGLIDLDIDVPTGDRVGALVGILRGSTLVNCYVCGGRVSADDFVGGLVGVKKNSTITHCHAAISVFGERKVGGLVGHNYSEEDRRAAVEDSYAVADVIGADNSMDVGGLVGSNSGTIKDCYVIGSVTAGASSDNVGGLAGRGYGTIANCYSAASVSAGSLSADVGGLVGLDSGRYVVGSYWDIETSGLTISGGGEGKTTAEMQTASTFIGWGCEPTVWTIDEGVDYPRLAWEDKPGGALPVLSEFLAGSGTQAEPYLICTAEELNTIALFPYAWTGHFKLMDDIDLAGLTGTDFNIIGYYRSDNNNKAFTGVFDGNGRRILNFSYASTDRDCIGLFGYIEGGVVKDLGLTNPNVAVEGGDEVGSLVGWIEEGAITDCHVEGGSVSGDYRVGGLAGINDESVISNCYTTCSVSATGCAGGLVGVNGYAAVITNCYSTGSVVADSHVGGLSGLIGFVFDYTVVMNSFWDTETSGQTTSAGGIGLTTAEMQRATTFLDAGWDFVGETANGTDDIWWILEGKDYPRLWWELGDETP